MTYICIWVWHKQWNSFHDTVYTFPVLWVEIHIRYIFFVCGHHAISFLPKSFHNLSRRRFKWLNIYLRRFICWMCFHGAYSFLGNKKVFEWIAQHFVWEEGNWHWLHRGRELREEEKGRERDDRERWKREVEVGRDRP